MKPFSCIFIFGFICYIVGMCNPVLCCFLSKISNTCITHFVCQKVVSQTTFCIFKISENNH